MGRTSSPPPHASLFFSEIEVTEWLKTSLGLELPHGRQKAISSLHAADSFIFIYLFIYLFIYFFI